MLVFKKIHSRRFHFSSFCSQESIVAPFTYSLGRSSGDVAGMCVPENCGGMAFIDPVASSPEKRALAVSDHGGAT